MKMLGSNRGLGLSAALAVAGLLTASLLVMGPDAGAQGAPSCRGQTATIVGDSRSNDIEGTNGRDVIVGRGGNDEIDGNGGPDLICGGRGNDELSGDTGDDRLYGGLGFDEADGDEGVDVCRAEDRDDECER